MEISKFTNIVSDFKKKKILVVGDIMVDKYTVGKINRISPEAPIPVMQVINTENKPGGACNVAENIHCLGAEAVLVGTVSDDAEGQWLKNHLAKNGMNTSMLIKEENRPTTVKERFVASNQQVMRIDTEVSNDIDASSKKKISDYFENNLDLFDAVILSDYQKGVLLSGDFVSSLIAICNKKHIPVIIDSKSKQIETFKGADVVKPNNIELYNAVGFNLSDKSRFDEAGTLYLEKSKAKSIMVTRGKNGISVFRKDRKTDFPAEKCEVYDVCGAGDTVIATASLCLASGMTLDESAILANCAAGIVIGKIGTSTVSTEELIRKLYEKQNNR